MVRSAPRFQPIERAVFRRSNPAIGSLAGKMLRSVDMNKALLTTLAATTLGLASQADELQTSTTRAASDNLENRFGAGLMLGEPSGLSVKYWMSETLAIDGGLGASFHRDDGCQVHSDVLWHAFDLFSVPGGRLPLYFGGGARLKFRDGDDLFGIRIPVGVSYMLDSRPIDVFFEVAPIVDLAPSVRGDINVAVGARFWF